MDEQPTGPDEAFARELEALDRDLEQRQRPDVLVKVVDLIPGLIAGMRLVGRPQ